MEVRIDSYNPRRQQREKELAMTGKPSAVIAEEGYASIEAEAIEEWAEANDDVGHFDVDEDFAAFMLECMDDQRFAAEEAAIDLIELLEQWMGEKLVDADDGCGLYGLEAPVSRED